MIYLILAIVGYISYLFGAVAFCQIIGGIRARSHAFAVVLWLLLTVAAVYLVYSFLNRYFIACAIGLGISLIQVLFLPNIE